MTGVNVVKKNHRKLYKALLVMYDTRTLQKQNDGKHLQIKIEFCFDFN